jgi:hypothetical protein
MQRPAQNASKSEHSTSNLRSSRVPIPASNNAQSILVRRIEKATAASIYWASVGETISRQTRTMLEIPLIAPIGLKSAYRCLRERQASGPQSRLAQNSLESACDQLLIGIRPVRSAGLPKVRESLTECTPSSRNPLASASGTRSSAHFPSITYRGRLLSRRYPHPERWSLPAAQTT